MLRVLARQRYRRWSPRPTNGHLADPHLRTFLLRCGAPSRYQSDHRHSPFDLRKILKLFSNVLHIVHSSRCRSSARRLCRLCNGANTSMCGSAACMPRVSGLYVGFPSNGFSHTNLPARLFKTVSAADNSSVSPVSQPSLNMMTMVRLSTNSGQPELNSARLG